MITREIVPVHAKPTGFTAFRWSQGSMPRKYAAHDTYSSIFLVHTLRQTEVTKEGRSKWRLWPLRPAVSCTRDGADWPNGCNRWAPTANQWFFWLYSNARHAVNKRRTSPGGWSQELSSDTKINEIRQRRPKWRQFKKWSVLLVCTIAKRQLQWQHFNNGNVVFDWRKRTSTLQFLFQQL